MFRELWGRRRGGDPSRSERECVAAVGDDGQMRMIRHQAIAQQAALVLPHPFGKDFQIFLKIRIRKENLLAVIPPLDHVVRDSDRNHAIGARHAAIVANGAV